MPGPAVLLMPAPHAVATQSNSEDAPGVAVDLPGWQTKQSASAAGPGLYFPLLHITQLLFVTTPITALPYPGSHNLQSAAAL